MQEHDPHRAVRDRAQAGDPRTFLIVSAVLIVVSLAACGVPALRAMRVEPLVALKSE